MKNIGSSGRGVTIARNKKEWQDYVGEYSCKCYGNTIDTSVRNKNGYLYVEERGGLKLNEYNPGYFFTADGEAVILQDDRMSLSNKPYLKKLTKTSLNIPQSFTIQPADKYADKREASVNRLDPGLIFSQVGLPKPHKPLTPFVAVCVFSPAIFSRPCGELFKQRNWQNNQNPCGG